MRMRRYLSFMILLFLFITSYYIITEDQEVSEPRLLLKEVKYQTKGVDAAYPQFISGADKVKLDKWNQIIEKDFKDMIAIYSFNPFPNITPEPTELLTTPLKINYEIKTLTDRFFSVLYKADYSGPYSAYPTELIYTTNIDRRSDKRLRLSDLVHLDKEFVRDFRSWDRFPYEEGNEELNQAITDYINSFSDQDLLKGFQTADQISSKNTYGIYSYLTQDRLGISFSLPNYAGDHVELEKSYQELSDKLRINMK